MPRGKDTIEALMWVAERMDVLALTEPVARSWESIFKQLRRDLAERLAQERTAHGE